MQSLRRVYNHALRPLSFLLLLAAEGQALEKQEGETRRVVKLFLGVRIIGSYFFAGKAPQKN